MDAVAIPGGRDVRASLDGSTAVDTCVVACPPHPEYGGSRSDERLRAVSDALPDSIACLRFDYGPWDEGRGERRDAENAVEWARGRFDSVGLFGYSFGADVALRTGARVELDALSVLAPTADGADVLADVACPVQVVYGERDDTVDWGPVVERASELGHDVTALPADHRFVGQRDRVAAAVRSFLIDRP